MVITPAQAYIAFQIGYLDAASAIEWAVKAASDDPKYWQHPDFAELASFNPNRMQECEGVGERLARIVGTFAPDFQAANEELFAKKLFRARLEDYVAETCTPWQVCRMVTAIENVFDYPDWLGNMYNACDWIEPDTMPVDCRPLLVEVSDTLKHLNDGSAA